MATFLLIIIHISTKSIYNAWQRCCIDKRWKRNVGIALWIALSASLWSVSVGIRSQKLVNGENYQSRVQRCKFLQPMGFSSTYIQLHSSQYFLVCPYRRFVTIYLFNNTKSIVLVVLNDFLPCPDFSQKLSCQLKANIILGNSWSVSNIFWQSYIKSHTISVMFLAAGFHRVAGSTITAYHCLLKFAEQALINALLNWS